ncbi:hypothetical protein BGZ65_004080 [Modicella reniformis]|uniref:Uncharacterized protein n=1 Tax=Modicella reniformis TaxID=1440133 RepID=A0A9P6IL47_9FUNG|nr:hypothetical protein BGZ65_004080 [Modicella reniformis]
MDIDENPQMNIERLGQRLLTADNRRKEWLQLKTRLALLYDDAVARIPVDDDKDENVRRSKEQFDKHLAPVEEEIKKADEHSKILQEPWGTWQSTLHERCDFKSVSIDSTKSPSIYPEEPDRSDVIPVELNKKYTSLTRVFDYKRIPVTSLETIAKTRSPRYAVPLKAIKKFETFCPNYLTEDLFDDLAWKYMNLALETADQNEKYDLLFRDSRSLDASANVSIQHPLSGLNLLAYTMLIHKFILNRTMMHIMPIQRSLEITNETMILFYKISILSNLAPAPINLALVIQS